MRPADVSYMGLVMGTKDLRGYFHLPNSGIILGHIVEALRLREHSVSGDEVSRKIENQYRTIHRVFTGERPSLEQLTTICNLIVGGMIEAGYLNGENLLRARECCLNHSMTCPEGDNLPATLIDDLTVSLRQMAISFDMFVSTLCIPDGMILLEESATLTAVRLAVPRLSFWYAAISITEGKEIAENEVPEWATESGGWKKLERVFEDNFPGATRDELSEKLYVSRSTLDRWLSHKNPLIPTDVDLKHLAAITNQQSTANQGLLLLNLRQHYAAWGLAAKVAEVVGWEKVGEAAKKICIFANRAKHHLLQQFPEEGHRELLWGFLYHFLIMGDLYFQNDSNLKYLLENEDDPEWREDILALIEHRYEARVLDSLASIHNQNRNAIEQRYATFLETVKVATEFLLAVWWAKRSEDYGDLHAVYEKDNSRTQQDFFEWLKKSEPYPELIRLAKYILKNPPNAFIEKSLSNSGCYHFTIGCIHFLHQEWKEALESFEEAIQRKYLASESFDHASYCAFMTGDGKTGRDYAKTANSMGVGRTFRLWQKGEFRNE